LFVVFPGPLSNLGIVVTHRSDESFAGKSSDQNASGGKKATAPGPESGKLVESLLGEEKQLGVVVEGDSLPKEDGNFWNKAKGVLIGKPRDLADQSLFHSVSLVAFLAWVGLGADGLSSSCYGPPESFGHLGEHASYLAIFLGVAIATTVFVIAACYSHIIEEFPSGGGGYLVASKLLGNRVGVISGCALLVDYVLTITVSIAAAGDAVFSLVGSYCGEQYVSWKLPCEYFAIIALIVLNLRGVKESVQVLMPVFVLFLITHAILIVGSIVMHIGSAGEVAHTVTTGLRDHASNPKLGVFGILGILLYAYSMGSGTYTGLEAVSNSMPVMREPRVATAKRTMRYMAWSLAFTAGGLIIAYLLLKIESPRVGSSETMNGILANNFVRDCHFPGWAGFGFVIMTLLSEGTLLVVAAQAGFIDGPRVLGYMAHDSWMPRWFANLSERLATHNGIMLMGLAALTALWYTAGSVAMLVLFYSINVFVTFSLSMIGMCRHWWELRRENPLWLRRLALFGFGAVVCIGILLANICMKFFEGGWLTVAVTGCLVIVAFLIHRYYRGVGTKLKKLDETLTKLVVLPTPNEADPDPAKPTAVILVGGYSGLGVHTMLNAIRFVPGFFSNYVFVSVGVVDSGNFKGSGAVEALRDYTQDNLAKYVVLARSLGMPAASYSAVGTDAVDELEELCLTVSQDFPKSTFFAGQLVFHKENWIDRLLHNQTAFSLQRRLQWAGFPMVILPCRVR
jgi:amino acid transporter